MVSTNFYDGVIGILKALRGVAVEGDSNGTGAGTTDPSPSIGGVSTVSNWRSRTAVAPTLESSTGKSSWVVPVGREWQLQSLSATLVTAAAAGNRQVEAFVNPHENSLIVYRHRFVAGAVQAASLTYSYQFALGEPLLLSPIGTLLSAPLPPVILPSGSLLCLWEKAQIAPTADVFSNVNLLVLERVIS